MLEFKMPSSEKIFYKAGEFEGFSGMNKEELLVSLNAIIYDDNLRTPTTVRSLVGKLADWEFHQDMEIEKLCLDALKFICRLRPELITPKIVEEVVSLFDHPNLVVAARAVRVYGYIAKNKPAEITSSRIQKLGDFLEEEIPFVKGEAIKAVKSFELKDYPEYKYTIDSPSRKTPDEGGYTNISAGELKRMLREKSVLVIDNRTMVEFGILKSPRLDELISLQGNRLMYIKEDDPDEKFRDLLSKGEDRIAVICRSDQRSAKLSQRLVRMGYMKVFNLRGGMINWKEDD